MSTTGIPYSVALAAAARSKGAFGKDPKEQEAENAAGVRAFKAQQANQGTFGMNPPVAPPLPEPQKPVPDDAVKMAAAGLAANYRAKEGGVGAVTTVPVDQNPQPRVGVKTPGGWVDYATTGGPEAVRASLAEAPSRGPDSAFVKSRRDQPELPSVDPRANLEWLHFLEQEDLRHGALNEAEANASAGTAEARARQARAEALTREPNTPELAARAARLAPVEGEMLKSRQLLTMIEAESRAAQEQIDALRKSPAYYAAAPGERERMEKDIRDQLTLKLSAFVGHPLWDRPDPLGALGGMIGQAGTTQPKS